MQNSPRSFQKFKKVPLILSLLFLGGSIFAFIFLYQQISENKATSEKMQQEWQAEESRRNQIDSLDRLIKSTLDERTMLDTHFAKSSDVVPFLDNIQKLATAVGAKSEIVSVDILKDKNAGLLVQVRATGSFESVYKFLTLLENSPYELDFNTVDLSNITKGGVIDGEVIASTWSIDLGIKLLSFVQ